MSFHIDWAAMTWTLAGIVGFVVRLALYVKFRGDVRAASNLTANGFREPICRRQLETTVMHLVLKTGIVTLGIATLLHTPAPAITQPTLFGTLATVVLVLIPCYLTLDGIREHRHQWRMLAYGEHLEHVAIVQHARGIAQDTRGIAQDTRQIQQDAAEMKP